MSLTVNGHLLPNQLIINEVERLRPDYERTFPDLSESERELQLCAWATENVIERTLLEQHVQTLDLTIDASQGQQAEEQLREAYKNPEELYAVLGCTDETQVRAQVETSLKVEAFLTQTRSAFKVPNAGEIKQYYEDHPEDYQNPERIHAAHIVMHVDHQQDESQAMIKLAAAQAELQQGAPFMMVAEKHSDCPERGGDLGFFARGQMVEEFEAIVFNLGVGQVSDVFRTRYGFHIATVYQRQASGLASLKEVQDRIRQELTEQRQNEAVYAFIDTLKEEADIVQAPTS